MKQIIYIPSGGERIEHACHEATRLARQHNALCRFDFNDVRLIAAPKKSPGTLLWEWEWTNKRERSAYRNSAKGREDARRRAAEIVSRQAKVTFLINDLPNACSAGLDKVMFWLSAFTEVADDIGVTWDHAYVKALLEGAGYKENAHVGRKPHEFTARQIMGEYIVGQAINCMGIGMPPHPVTLGFVEKYFELP